MKPVNFWKSVNFSKPIKSKKKSKKIIKTISFGMKVKSMKKINLPLIKPVYHISIKPIKNIKKSIRKPVLGIGLQPTNSMKKNMTWSEAKRVYPNLSPFKDADGDGVKNYKDCKPFDRKRQDFGRFRSRPTTRRGMDGYTKPEEFTAAQRFGGANIRRLKRLSAGRDRTVYVLDKGKVIKIAKNIGGVKQNISESDLDYILDHVKHYETGKDYVVMEKIGKVKSPAVKAKLKKMFEEVQKERFERGRGWGPGDKAKRAIEKVESGILNYDFSAGDIAKKSSWGEKKGKPVLIDAGGLSSDTLSSEHRITKISEKLGRARRQREEIMESIKKHGHGGSDFDKRYLPKTERDIASMEEDIKEWGEIQRQRKQYARKGEKEIKEFIEEEVHSSDYDLQDEDDKTLDYAEEMVNEENEEGDEEEEEEKKEDKEDKEK